MQIDRVSRFRLATVTPSLRRVISLAIENADRHIRVTCGIRTPEEQKTLVRTGKSRTLRSKHLPQAPDMLSHAVDLVLINDGAPDWGMGGFVYCAEQVRKYAITESVSVVWGAVWDTPLADLTGELDAEVAAYWDRFTKARNRKPFVDAPHFQLGV